MLSFSSYEGDIAVVFGSDPSARKIGMVHLETDTFVQYTLQGVVGAPRWSPDGAFLAIPVRSTDSKVSIVLLNVDSREFIDLPHQSPRNILPRWRSDSRAVAYQTTNLDGSNARIAVYDLDTEEESIWAGGQEGVMRPVWLPNLDLMLLLDPRQELEIPGVDIRQFMREASELGVIICIGYINVGESLRTEIFVATASQAINILPIIKSDSHRYVEWAVEPDRRGRFIAFESNDGGNREIYVLGRRGLVNVSNHREADWNPIWSPARDLLLFESFRGGKRGLYRVHPETAHIIPVTGSVEVETWSPTWSPDGNWIAYIGNEAGSPQLYLSDAEGTHSLPVLSVPTPVFLPAWRPVITGGEQGD